MTKRPFTAAQVSDALSSPDCDTEACVLAALQRLDAAWEELESAAEEVMLADAASDLGEEQPSQAVMDLVEAFAVEADEGELEKRESADDCPLLRYRKRRHRLSRQNGPLDYQLLELLGQALEALYDAFFELDGKAAPVLAIVDHLQQPKAVLGFMEGEGEFAEEEESDANCLQFVDWETLDGSDDDGEEDDFD